MKFKRLTIESSVGELKLCQGKPKSYVSAPFELLWCALSWDFFRADPVVEEGLLRPQTAHKVEVSRASSTDGSKLKFMKLIE